MIEPTLDANGKILGWMDGQKLFVPFQHFYYKAQWRVAVRYVEGTPSKERLDRECISVIANRPQEAVQEAMKAFGRLLMDENEVKEMDRERKIEDAETD